MSLDDLQAQLRGALDQQFAALKTHYEQAIADARRQAQADAEGELQQKLDAARAEWEVDLRAQLDAARGESQVQLRARLEAARGEWEGELRTQVDAARAEAEQAVASTRRSAELELESERRHAQKDLSRQREQASAALQAERQRAKDEIDALRQRVQADAAAPAAPAPLSPTLPAGRVLAGLQALDAAETLSQALETLLQHAAAVAGRAAIFLINGDRLKAWKAVGIPDIDVQTVESSIGASDLLARAIQSGHVESSGPSAPAPPFARLASDRIGVAAPLLIGGRPVAVLYADTGADAKAAQGWPDAVDMIARHGSATIALRTAARTLDVLRGGADAGAGGDEGARRYARLLVSEIKLYNEPAVRAGRQQRDLLHRLRTEIDRAQRLYEERVSPAIGARQAYFQQELVQTLADGDATLLGN